MYRYWDGSQWTDHHSPKAGPPKYEDRSGAGIIGSAWELFKDNWTSLLGIGALTFVGFIAGALLIVVAAASALDPDIFDIIDRVMQPGFDADNDPLDRAYIDSIDFDASASFFILAGIGVVLVWVVTVLGMGAATLLLGARHHGEPMGAGQCFGLAFRRVGRWIGISLLWGLVGFLPLVLLWVLAIAVSPALLFLVVPLTLAVVIYFFPIMTIAGGGLFVGPTDKPPFRTALAIVKPQWGTVAGRVLVVNLILFAINLGLGVVNLIPIIGILINLVGQFVYYGLQTATSVKLYASVDAPFAEELAPNSGPWELPVSDL